MKIKRVLLVSCSIILLCMSIIIAMTYALYTDKLSVKNHFEAGQLNLTLQRTYLEYKAIDNSGKSNVVIDDSVYDFTGKTDKNMFGMDAGDIRIAPGSYFEAKLRIINDDNPESTNYSNVAFTYSVEIVLLTEYNALADQLQVVVTNHKGESTTMRLSDLTDGYQFEVGTLLAGEESEEFSVKVTFLDGASSVGINNNAAMGKRAVFDLVVNAVQTTKAAE